MSMVKTLQRTQDSHKAQLTHLRQQFGDREQELVSQVTLLSNQILKSREEQLVYVGHLEQAHAEARRLGSALSLAEAKADAATTANISEENLGDTTSLRQELLQAKQDLEIMREKMHSEEVTNKQKVTTTLQVAQNRINELDMAYFRVEAELNIKTSEAKKYYSKVRQLEEEASAQDRLRRKAELKLDEETQKRNMTDKTMAAMEAEVETMKETLRTNRASLDEAQRQLEIMKFTQEAAEEDMTILLEKNSSLKVAMEKLRSTVGCVNDLEYELSEMSKAKALRESEIAVLEGEISVLMPLKEEVACLQEKVRELEGLLAEAEAAKKLVVEKDARCTDVISQFDDLTKTNSVLLEENAELEDQVETLSLAFAQRGELLKDLERRLDVSTSDAAYLRSDNAKAREQVRELGEKVQTLMINYNEASSQNEEKGFAVRLGLFYVLMLDNGLQVCCTSMCY
jgi:chromosome segregation ATPase